MLCIMKRKDKRELLNKCKWSNISIAKYNRLNGLLTDDVIDTDKIIDIMQIIFEMPKEKLLEMNINDFNELLLQVIKLKEVETQKLKRIYMINGKSYKLKFKYDTWKKEFDVSTDQYMSFMNVLKANPEDIAAILSVVLVPTNAKFNKGYDLLELKSDIENYLSIEDGMGIVFFLNLIFSAYYGIHTETQKVNEAKLNQII